MLVPDNREYYTNCVTGDPGSCMESIRAHPYEPSAVDGVVLEPVQAHVLFRHGDRSPSPFTNKDPERWVSRLQDASSLLQELDYHGQEFPWGRLTRKGAQQSRELGSWLRKNYLKPLSLQDPTSSLRVRSTNFKRSHMTVWYVLEGLLGSTSGAASVPIRILPEYDENLYNNESCPRLQKLYRTRWRNLNMLTKRDSDETSSWQRRYEGVKKALQAYFQLPDVPLFPWVPAIDVVNCGRCHGDTLPEGVLQTDIDEVIQALAEDYVATFQDKEVCQLSMGRLVKEITDWMVEIRDQPEAHPRLFLYSGHDATIMPLSVCLGSAWKTWPDYVSFIIVELLKCPSGDQLYVRVLYNGREEALSLCQPGEALPPAGPAKKGLFTLEEFLGHVSWCLISDEDFRTQCHISDL